MGDNPYLPKLLYQKLKRFENRGISTFKEELLNDEFVLLGEIITLLPTNMTEEFGLYINEFYRRSGKEEELVLWAIQREITDTDMSSDLFRMQSFATQLLFKIFFGDRGRDYLTNTVLHIISTIMSMKEDKLELIPNGITVSVDEAYDNLRFLLDTIRQLFYFLDLKIALMPRIIRKGFVCMRQYASKKFPEVKDSVVPIFLFLRCLCPTLIQPEQFGLTKEKLEGHTQKALIIISKLLQNIANGIVKNNITTYTPHDKYVLSFIKESIITVQKLCNKLTDLDHMGKGKQMAITSEKEKEDAFQKVCLLILGGKFRQLLEELTRTHEKKEKFERANREDLEKFLKSFEDISSSDWKKFKEAEGITGYICKSAQPQYRYEGTIPLSVYSVTQNVNAMSCDNWFNVLKDKCIVYEKSKYVSNIKGGERWLLKLKFPFPYGPKTTTIDKISVDISDVESATLFRSFHRSPVKLDACIHFKQHAKDEFKTKFVMYYRLNLDWTFPQTTVLSMGKENFRVVSRLCGLLLGTPLSKKSSLLKSANNSPLSYSPKKNISLRKLRQPNTPSVTSDESPSDSSTSTTSTSGPNSTSNSTSVQTPYFSGKSRSVGSIRKKTHSYNLAEILGGEPLLHSTRDILCKSDETTEENKNIKNIEIGSGQNLSKNIINDTISSAEVTGKSSTPQITSKPSIPKLTPTKVRRRSNSSKHESSENITNFSKIAPSPHRETPRHIFQRDSPRAAVHSIATPKTTRAFKEQETPPIIENSEDEVSLISDEDMSTEKKKKKTRIKIVRRSTPNLEKNKEIDSESDSPDLLSISE